MDAITYKKDDVLRMVAHLNSIAITGLNDAKRISAIADIIDCGIPGVIRDEGNAGAEIENGGKT